MGWRQKTPFPAGVLSVLLGVLVSSPCPAGGLAAPGPRFMPRLEDTLTPTLQKARLARPHLVISFTLSKHGRVVHHIPQTSNPLALCLSSFSLFLMPHSFFFFPDYLGDLAPLFLYFFLSFLKLNFCLT